MIVQFGLPDQNQLNFTLNQDFPTQLISDSVTITRTRRFRSMMVVDEDATTLGMKSKPVRLSVASMSPLSALYLLQDTATMFYYCVDTGLLHI